MRIPLTALLLAPAVVFAGSSTFDGTWKTKADSMQTTGKPNVTQLVNGEYTCASCDPPYTVKADGEFHETKGNPYHDSVAVKVLSPTSVEIMNRLAGKVTADEVRGMNYAVDSEHRDVGDVVREFRKGKGL